MDKIKQKIKTAIKRAKIKQRQLAQKIGISEQMLSYYLNPEGKARIPEHILEQIRNVVNLEVEEETTAPNLNQDAETITEYMNLNSENKEIIREIIRILIKKQ